MKKVSSVRRCRLCASEDILNNFHNIFDDNSELKLEMKIRKLLPVMVMPWDPMPHVVCHDCTDKLNTFNEFYERSLNTERFLRTLHNETPETASASLQESKKGPEKRDGDPGKSSNRLVITPIGCRKYVYTCRRCCRTFTEKSSATSHPCAEAEDCRELKEDKKCLPPLKIRLFAVRSGLFVCCLCNKQFEDKGELGKHIKGHFLEGNSGEEETTKTKCNKERGRGGRCRREGDEKRQPLADRPNSRRRRKTSGLRSLKRRRTTTRRLLQYQSGTCEESSMQEEKICSTSTSSTKETTEDQTERPDPDVSQGRDTEMTDSRKSVTNDPGEMEISKAEDDVIVVEVIEKRIPTTLSSCVFCDKIFATKESLLAHKSKHLKNFRSKSGRGDPFLCDVCPKTFPSEWTLMEHLRGHNWGPPDGQTEALTSLNGFSPGESISNNLGIVTSGEEEIPLVDVT